MKVNWKEWEKKGEEECGLYSLYVSDKGSEELVATLEKRENGSWHACVHGLMGVKDNFISPVRKPLTEAELEVFKRRVENLVEDHYKEMAAYFTDATQAFGKATAERRGAFDERQRIALEKELSEEPCPPHDITHVFGKEDGVEFEEVDEREL